MENDKENYIEFTRTNKYQFVKFIENGQGGTGKTALLHDTLLNEDFACKKYEPSVGNDKEECFERFIDEIKILYQLSHINIVRIYSYFLYPKQTTGYILMEYINGSNLQDYLQFEIEETYESVFIQLIEGFYYLENHEILHRDIKPNNILVTSDGIVKIIDFGFGKKVTAETDEEASVLLNWPVTELPQEIHERHYDSKTDMYFLGKMFNAILINNAISGFKYQDIVDRMIIVNPANRIQSFANIKELLSANIMDQLNFSLLQKEYYKKFADALSEHILYYDDSYPAFEENPNNIIAGLEKLIANTILEDYLQDNRKLILCFLSGNYTFDKTKNISVGVITNFYKLLKEVSENKRIIIVENIITRLKSISIEIVGNDLPF